MLKRNNIIILIILIIILGVSWFLLNTKFNKNQPKEKINQTEEQPKSRVNIPLGQPYVIGPTSGPPSNEEILRMRGIDPDKINN